MNFTFTNWPFEKSTYICGRQDSMDLIPGRRRNIFLPHRVETGSTIHPAFLPLGTNGYFSVVEAPGA
jgi:hypothetical protein